MRLRPSRSRIDADLNVVCAECGARLAEYEPTEQEST